jgi:hypothetical protein
MFKTGGGPIDIEEAEKDEFEKAEDRSHQR